MPAIIPLKCQRIGNISVTRNQKVQLKEHLAFLAIVLLLFIANAKALGFPFARVFKVFAFLNVYYRQVCKILIFFFFFFRLRKYSSK